MSQPPLEEQLAHAKATMTIEVDGDNRMAKITLRKPLDITPTVVNLAFCTIKGLAGQIILAEAQNEENEHKQALKDGVLKLTH